jgi:hypothetical protein
MNQRLWPAEPIQFAYDDDEFAGCWPCLNLVLLLAIEAAADTVEFTYSTHRLKKMRAIDTIPIVCLAKELKW